MIVGRLGSRHIIVMEDTEICDLEDETKSDSESDVAVAKTLEENGKLLIIWIL